MDDQTVQIVLAMIGTVSVSIAAMRFVLSKVLETYTRALDGILESQRIAQAQVATEFSEGRVVMREIAGSLSSQTEILRGLRDERNVEKAAAVAAAAVAAAAKKRPTTRR